MPVGVALLRTLIDQHNLTYADLKNEMCIRDRSYDVQISPLNAIWLITLGLCGLFVSLYNIDWHRHAQVKCNGLQIRCV